MHTSLVRYLIHCVSVRSCYQINNFLNVDRLTETQNELESMKRQSTSEKMFTDAEVRELRSK